ncbi:MAG: carboxypeptidase regulatory-like domain-containing protein [Acidobacteria bacterium]|nr:carboxypeptidase regulatory-like domain-containing protein [Acidobacteriota bacterium]
MDNYSRKPFTLFLLTLLTLVLAVAGATAQSQALNGQIEGTVTDANSAAVAGATVSVRNLDTGAERSVTTDSEGSYRLPLLPLGKYRVTVEAPNFKKFVQEGVTLTTGSTATINVSPDAWRS